MAFSVTQSMYMQPNDWMIGNNESERKWKVSVAFDFQLLSGNLPEVNEEKNESHFLKIVYILGKI